MAFEDSSPIGHVEEIPSPAKHEKEVSVAPSFLMNDCSVLS